MFEREQTRLSSLVRPFVRAMIVYLVTFIVLERL